MKILVGNNWDDEDFAVVGKWYPEIDIDCTFDRCKMGIFKGVFYFRITPEQPSSCSEPANNYYQPEKSERLT